MSAYDWFGSAALLPVGYAIVGPLAATFGITTMLWVAFAALVGPALAVLCVRDVRDLVHEV